MGQSSCGPGGVGLIPWVVSSRGRGPTLPRAGSLVGAGVSGEDPRTCWRRAGVIPGAAEVLLRPWVTFCLPSEPRLPATPNPNMS